MAFGLIETYEEAVGYLDRHIGRGMHPGLTRITELLDLMGNPEDAYPIIHIAGTNGKTSVSRMTTMILVAHGLTTGTFTSPHLERIEERISLNGVVATPEQFIRAIGDVAAFADLYEERTGNDLSYFELTAAMALGWFADEAADAAVIEVGLGGRLDATNAVRGSVAVLTSVGLDHQEYLGDSLEAIAREKLGILEEGATLVTGPLQDEVRSVVDEMVAEKDVNLLTYGTDFQVEGSVPAVGGWSLDISGVYGLYEDLHLPLHGRHQTINLAVGVAAAEALTGRKLDPEAVSDATAVTTVPGRLEPVETVPPVMLDGAHNPHGFAALGSALREEFPSIKWVLVLGTMEDKDAAGMVASVADRLTGVVTTTIDSPRALPASDVAAAVRSATSLPTEAIESPVAALQRAKALAGSDGQVLVAGSLYLVGWIRGHLRGNDTVQRNER